MIPDKVSKFRYVAAMASRRLLDGIFQVAVLIFEVNSKEILAVVYK